VQLVKGDVEHPGPLVPVARGVPPGEAGRVITGRDRVGRPSWGRRAGSEGLDWSPGS